MLTIISANPTGLGPYGMHEDVLLEGQGVVWLTGENLDKGGSNGAGKTWFFNTISQCLFGRIESYSGGTVATNDEVSNELLGLGSCPRIEFIARTGDKWRVTYSRKWKPSKGILSPYVRDSDLYPFKGTDVYLERFDGFDWKDERCSSMAKTREKLREIVGISYERYLATTYLAQGKGLDFLRGSHAQKMAIFSDTVDLAIWDRAAEAFKSKRDATRFTAQSVLERLSTLKGRLSGLQSISAEAYELKVRETAELEASTVEAGELKKQLQDEAVKHAAKVDELLQSVDKNPYLDVLTEIDKARHKEVAEFDEAIRVEQVAKSELYLQYEKSFNEIALERVGLDRDKRLAEQKCQYAVKAIQEKPLPGVDLRASIRSKEITLAKLNRTLKDLRDGKLSTCPTCGQSIDPGVNEEHILTETAQIQVDIEALTDALQKCTEGFDAQKEVDTAKARKELADKLSVLTAKDADLANDIEELNRLKKVQHAKFEKKVKDIDAKLAETLEELKIKADTARSLAEAFELKVESTKRSAAEAAKLRDEANSRVAAIDRSTYEMALTLAKLRGETEHYEKTESDRKSLESAIAQVAEEQAAVNLDEIEWAWLTKNVGDKGIKSFLIEQACLRLNELLGESLADLDGSFQVWCQPNRLKAGAESKKEAELTSEDFVQDFTIYVRDGEKKEVPLYLYSGGESSLLAFAFLVAFWRLSDERGSGTNLLLLDEVVSALDQRNSQIVVKFLESLKASGKTVIAVSHSQVVDSVDFDATWTCRKQGGVSQLFRA